MLDKYLWNEQSAVVFLLFGEELEAQYPDVDGWYEIKRGKDLFIAEGCVVIEVAHHAWVGCPRSRSIEDLIDKIQSTV